MLAVVRKQRDSFFRLVVAPAAPGVERGVGRGIARRRVGTVLNVRDSRSLRVVLAVVAVLCFVLVGTPRVVAQTSTAPRQEVPSSNIDAEIEKDYGSDEQVEPDKAADSSKHSVDGPL